MQYWPRQRQITGLVGMSRAEAFALRLEAMNGDNHVVLEALEGQRMRTHRNGVDTTEQNKALYRQRIDELEALIARVRRVPQH